jgi:murein DD-endopeptidase MepM/ murein hydrolase activator NlpD
MPSHPRARRVAVRCTAAVVLAVLAVPMGAAARAGAVSDAGAGSRTTRAARTTGTTGAGAAPVSPGSPVYRPPLDRPVVDPFRAPATPYGPGNRGLEYATVPGDVAAAIGDGVVVFAGDVAGRGVVTVAHPDGLRSSLTGLVVVLVRPGQVVARGTPLGTTGTLVHLGVRAGDRYIDPALLFGERRPRHAVLVPTRSRPALGARGPG